MRIRKADPKVLKIHPLAHLIPDMRGSEWQEFYTDIVMRGIKVPLEVLADGTVVDGRHRLRAAIELGMKEVPIVDAHLNGDSPEVYMLKAAVLRRHLTDDQRAMLAALWKEHHKQTPQAQPRTERGTFAKPLAERPANGDGPDVTRTQAKELFNVSRYKIDVASYVHNRNSDLATKVHQGDIALKNAYRQVKSQEEKTKIALTKPPVGTYQVIVIDPPWPYSNRQRDPSHQISSPYESMPIEKLKDLKIPAATDSVLWLWTTNAFLHEAFHLLETWGFTYRTILTWAKNFVGLGDWLGGQTEHCLLATKGNYRIFRNNESTLLEAPRGKHSEKPDVFYELVERLCPGQKIEMFARKQRSDWQTWGAEVDG
ncbi:MT-A70 family methyltransferase [Dehalococcoidia bacterium]|nr:MT-A70 family methyltransferase [Dehalococcoidia bacterium]